MKIMIALSALAPSQYRKYVKGWNKGRYAQAFKEFAGEDAYRIYLPLNRVSTDAIPAPSSINAAIEALGYKVEDYRAGIAVDSSGKRKIRIGKLLGKHPDLQKLFNEDKKRAAYKGKHVICISRHPYDIAGMSTGRGWTSCMNLKDGINREYVAAEINVGTIVAYLVEEKDLDLKRPVARIAIKPFYREDSFNKGKAILVAEPTAYGTKGVEGFTSTVQRWLDKHINKGARKGSYILNDESYNDNTYDYEHLGTMSDKEVAKKLDYSDKGVAVFDVKETRLQILRTRPEVLLFMKAPCILDLYTVATYAPSALIKYIEANGKTYIEPGTFKEMRLASSGDVKDAMISAVIKDYSLFDRAFDACGGSFTGFDYRMMVATNPEQAFMYIPENLISNKIITDTIKGIQVIQRLKEFVAEIPKSLIGKLPSKEAMIKKYPRWIFTLDPITKEDLLLALETHSNLVNWLYNLPNTVIIAETVLEFFKTKGSDPSLAISYIVAFLEKNNEATIVEDKYLPLVMGALSEIQLCSFGSFATHQNELSILSRLPPDALTSELSRRNLIDGFVFKRILNSAGFANKYSRESLLNLRAVDFHNLLGSPELIEENFFTIKEYSSGLIEQLINKAPEILTACIDHACTVYPNDVANKVNVLRDKDFWGYLYETDKNLGASFIQKIDAAGDSLIVLGRVFSLFQKLPEYLELFAIKPWVYNWPDIYDGKNLLTPYLRKYILSVRPEDFPGYENDVINVQNHIVSFNAREGKVKINVPL